MRLILGPDDEAAFEQACDELLERLEDSGPAGAAAVADVALALDWKWGYGDGNLASWTPADADEFLLSWCPRKVSVPPAEAAALPASLATFVGFLAAEGLLDPASAPPAVMRAHLAPMANAVVAAMGDRSRFGMAKSLLAGLGDLGLVADLDDPASLQEAMDRFNALPFDERGRLLGLGGPPPSPWEGLLDGVELPPAAPLPADELAALAATAPVVNRVRIVRRFVADGRKLTAKGNLGVADATALAGLLGEPALARRAEWGERVRSADDLPELQFTIRWARAAGAVRVAKGRLLPTATWNKLDPVGAATRSLVTLLERGPLATWAATNRWGWGPDGLTELLDEGAVHLLAALWAVPDGVDYDDLLEAAVEVCDAGLEFPPQLDPDVRSIRIRVEFELLVDVLAVTGVLTRHGATETPGRWGGTERHGGTVGLTRLGRGILGPYLTEHGYPVPVVGELADAPLAALLSRADKWHPDRVRAEFDGWVQRHSAAAAADGLAGALADDYPDPLWPAVALELAGRLEPAEAERAVRRLLDTPARGHAIGWLTQRDAADVPDDPEAMLRAGVEMLAVYAAGDDERLLEAVGKIDDIHGFIADIWRVPVPAAAVVLEGIGRIHPDKAVAKAARKAAFRQRSHTANVGQ